MENVHSACGREESNNTEGEAGCSFPRNVEMAGLRRGGKGREVSSSLPNFQMPVSKPAVFTKS